MNIQMKTKKQKIIKNKGGFNNPRQQSGYILIVSVILLGAMLIATLQYFEQSKSSFQTSGYSRNSAEALLLAESAANMLYGQYIYGDDHLKGFDEDNLNNLPLPYMYYRSNNTNQDTPDTIDESQPGILQLIANGEARSSSRTTVNTGKHKIPGSAENLVITELFSNVDNTLVKPIIYEIDNDGKLTISTSNSWTSVTAEKKAVAWLELVKNPATNTIKIYVQAVAQIGNSKNYVQRFVGVFKNNLGIISTTMQSN